MQPSTLATVAPASTPAERNRSTWVHLSAFAGALIPFGNIVGPLVVWKTSAESLYVNANGMNAVNFQISMTIWLAIAAIACLILIGFLAVAVLAIVWLVAVIKAAMAAGDGRVHEYPFTINFLK